ncbi:FKBP-type peptidyl-prolyl cis-trans isomerase [Weeksellaceae bacterium KMM 9713]|uniref:Peptidyl-prolyl cis-trans isomerase n=1 Tax=Profundicola chukchiensis TaxID=2961959 RepID=A0A9X4RXM6_9FLAO|nr:FKBP-type peptidyl-prolyl cis-trans isomerase [Profundicola chukchiensis]MDG4946754.1 FKBP-type peptidyl-prolyl cis-trans isomerase [Profundicola chukchiensis]
MQKNLKILLFSLVLASGFLVSCKKAPPQYPTVYSNDGFLEYSKKFNKQLKDLEDKDIQIYIQKHEEDFLPTNAGFYMTRTEMVNVRNVKDFDTIRFNYQISNMQDSIIYSYDDIGNQLIVMGQASMIPGIEYGLKRMSEGEYAKLLVPSSLAYGVDGDRKNIGTDEPLVIEINLEDIVNYEK